MTVQEERFFNEGDLVVDSKGYLLRITQYLGFHYYAIKHMEAPYMPGMRHETDLEPASSLLKELI
jgi:hypothetical protein